MIDALIAVVTAAAVLVGFLLARLHAQVDRSAELLTQLHDRLFVHSADHNLPLDPAIQRLVDELEDHLTPDRVAALTMSLIAGLAPFVCVDAALALQNDSSASGVMQVTTLLVVFVVTIAVGVLDAGAVTRRLTKLRRSPALMLGMCQSYRPRSLTIEHSRLEHSMMWLYDKLFRRGALARPLHADDPEDVQTAVASFDAAIDAAWLTSLSVVAGPLTDRRPVRRLVEGIERPGRGPQLVRDLLVVADLPGWLTAHPATAHAVFREPDNNDLRDDATPGSVQSLALASAGSAAARLGSDWPVHGEPVPATGRRLVDLPDLYLPHALLAVQAQDRRRRWDLFPAWLAYGLSVGTHIQPPVADVFERFGVVVAAFGWTDAVSDVIAERGSQVVGWLHETAPRGQLRMAVAPALESEGGLAFADWNCMGRRYSEVHLFSCFARIVNEWQFRGSGIVKARRLWRTTGWPSEEIVNGVTWQLVCDLLEYGGLSPEDEAAVDARRRAEEELAALAVVRA